MLKYSNCTAGNFPHFPDMFGASLDEIYGHESNAVPFVVQKLCGYLSTNERMKTKGLFRVNGNVKFIKKIKQMFDTMGNADLDAIDNVNACGRNVENYWPCNSYT